MGLGDVVTIVYVYEVCELYDAYGIKVYEVFIKRHDAWFQRKMSCLHARLSYIVHSCTKTILLHLFIQSVSYESLKDVSKVKGLICDSQTHGKGCLCFKDFLHYVYVKLCNCT